ncbi:MAG: tyrosine-protein phosphatase [Gemmobacter sp.]
MHERRLPLTGAVNFRDLGGYPAAGGRRTRWRTLYRSDSLAELTPDDQAALMGLGLRTLCDFRLPAEAARKPDRLPEGHGIDIRAMGFIPEGTLDMLAAIEEGTLDAGGIEAEVLRHYARFVTDHAADYRPLFVLLLEGGALPLLIHCTSGKDRTGIAAAAILLALGTPRDVILADYALTNTYRRDIRHLFRRPVSDAALHALTAASPAYLARALAAMDEGFGGPEGWLETIGIDAPARADLRARLTEPA